MSRLLFRLGGAARAEGSQVADGPPLRAELFGADQMEQLGQTLAAAHRLSTRHAPDQLLQRLDQNEGVLARACDLLTATLKDNRRISPAGEWLLDNFYLIEEQIRTARRHLPKGYSAELPQLATGERAGMPRVYDIALETISHGDGRVDPESLSRFVAAYQKVTALNLGELWAIPIMLRLALIENLRRVAARTKANAKDRDLAGIWADQMLEKASQDPKNLILVVADMARSNPPMASAFVAELARRLQGQSAALALPLTWIEQRLSESGLTIERVVQSETQIQASSQVSVANSIGSLRFLGAMDWREFVESMSGVEHTLRQDPAGVYARMDFATRDRYRHAIEKIARDSGRPEGEVARKAIELAREGAAIASDPRSGPYGDCLDRAAHVGHYLVDRGLPALQLATQAQLPLAEAAGRTLFRSPLATYLGAIGLFTFAFSVGLLARTPAAALQGWTFAAMAALTVFCGGHLAIALVNWLATLLTTPRPLSRLDFSAGIPADCQTLVVIPSMLANARNIEALVVALEVRFLANRDKHLQFGLLTDFADAQAQALPGDSALLLLTRTRIEELNAKYRQSADSPDTGPFYLFHRPRSWNPEERIWMGYERKRGKLAELNALTRGSGLDRFALIVGDTGALRSARYVITLDTDTLLPRDSARQLVGAMAHPLNRPRVDSERKVVTEGYGILQPRVAANLAGANRSRYARLFGSEPGIDPYTRIVSDVYQDVFDEGSFIGKGIYDIDAFEQSLKGRFPDNRILSHDLLEGCYARSGLLSDVQVYEDYPSSYLADVSRRYRWIRGDWQIASWILSRVPAAGKDAGAESRGNPLSALSQWKILDNLRRSLVPAALTLFLLLGWSLASTAWFWTLAVVGILLFLPVLATILELVRKPEDMLMGAHLLAVVRSAAGRISQAALQLVFLPHEAWYSLGAVLRTNWRILVTRQKRLEWIPSGRLHAESENTFSACCKSMWIAPLVSFCATAYLAATQPHELLIAGPILFAWLVSPVVAWWLSRPLTRRDARLSTDETDFLRAVARKTWAFFETFVGAEEHWLPPDNFQEHPRVAIAHRTSPTNMGLSLLANLAAYDFGYLTVGKLLARTANSLDTMTGLQRYQGHFYNWYDTLTLQPLPPLYISSVDSGNLAGHLLTLRPGLLALPRDSILAPRLFEGLLDTLGALSEAMKPAATAATPAALAELAGLTRALQSATENVPSSLPEVQACLLRLEASATTLAALLVDSEPQVLQSAPSVGPRWWAQALAGQCSDTLDELAFLAPWLAHTGMTERLRDLLGPTGAPTLQELVALKDRWQAGPGAASVIEATPADREIIEAIARHLADAAGRAAGRIAEIERIAALCAELAVMEYDFLYDKTRHLLSIGYNVGDRRLDPSCYDLLASEARLTTFVAIAQGQIPQESWFALGRLLSRTDGESALMSWSGSMFEYLMPLLVMPTFANTLLDQTCHAAVARQIAYGKRRGVAWGISESGYNAVDVALNYQYRAFGVPGLGLKRGLAEDLVIAPYASALALMVLPGQSCRNLQRLAAEGLAGPYGFYEAVDHTKARLPRGHASAVIRSFMAHHQGMIFLSVAHLLLNRPMQKRFASDPIFQATALLLQEQVPKAGAYQLHAADASASTAVSAESHTQVRMLRSPDTPVPEVQLLSNGRYHVMVTSAGGGYSRWKDLAVTRWREDATCDNWGMFCYVRDVASGVFWSNTHQPTLRSADTYETVFTEGRAEFHRRDLEYDVHTEIVVSPEDDIELRRVNITNRARTRRTVELTSYAEVVLADPVADALHPAFSNLFVQTEIIRERQAIVCTRRPRSPTDLAPSMFHLMEARGGTIETVSYETDRMHFIGRGRTLASPAAMGNAVTLSDSAGSVLDPVVAIRYRITLDPEEVATLDMVCGVAATRDAALNLAGKYQDRQLADRVFGLAWTHSQVVLRQINASEADAQLYCRLAGSVIYASSGLRADTAVLSRNRRGQSGLWGYAISGDLPIVLLQIGDLENIDLLRQLVQAHAYWRLKGLAVDLVIWNEDRAGYRQVLQEQILGLIAAGVEAQVINRPGGIFVRPADQISDEDRTLVQSVARVIVSDRRGTLGEQLIPARAPEARLPHLNMPRLKPARVAREDERPPAVSARRELLCANGLGGFSMDGREYVITTTREQVTPAPWVNVLANAHFGSVVSESGMAYTWSENAHEFRLTPWNNDPVSDASGEAFYLRDEESGRFWSPSPLPCRGATPYVTRHGFGYSVFEHTEQGIRSELTVFVALDSAVKFSVLKISNLSGRARRLSVTGYVEWVLGDLRPKSAMHVITEVNPDSGAFCARNAYNTEFADRIAFFDVDDATRTYTGDRAEFIGRNGTLAKPAAMSRAHLSNISGAALDPCAAIQVSFELNDGEVREVNFRLGVAGRRGADDADKLVRRFRGAVAARNALEAVREYWERTLGAVQVETPDAALNLLANGWLVYQTLTCRLWGRSGYYQSGGAFGFRDQLQDVMALVHAEPVLVREHLLRCAARQFLEGDVQHWWHPTSGRGVRTHCSDDFLWLPLAACRYVTTTGDAGVLDESVPFLEARALGPEEDSYYDLPNRAAESAPLYEHCVRAIRRGLRFGAHGLPLIGSGDWNDGMNAVGEQGRGESVWLGFFLYHVLMQFSGLASARNDSTFAALCDSEALKLRKNIELSGWDGEWYLRAFFDDGTPLGSASNTECQIDAIPQSWAVLSGGGDPARARKALAAVDQRLVRREDALIQVLDPPFDKSAVNPGYIKGYVPGVRENGGQYTHAAIWTVMAFAAQGDSKRAWELFGLINPLNHTNSAAAVAIYKVEPYVVAADVYAVAPHTGHGGWTWYTGSAGWMYRLVLESLLGLTLESDQLRISPCLPSEWEGFKLHYRYRRTMYHITVSQSLPENGEPALVLDGVVQVGVALGLIDDLKEHTVEVRVSRVQAPATVIRLPGTDLSD